MNTKNQHFRTSDQNSTTGFNLNSGIGIWDETKTYPAGSILFWNGKWFTSNSSTTSAEPGDLSNSPDVSGEWSKGGILFPPRPLSQTWGFNHAETKNITITGDFLTPDIEVVIPGQTINSVTFIGTHEISVNITSNSTDGFYDIVISNNIGSGTITNGFEVKLSTWIDLRLGGEIFTDGNSAGNDIRYHSSMAMTRDANGMYFTGLSPWSSWVKIESEKWTRGLNKTVSWIFSGPDSAMMIGIGSDATDEVNTAQYAQMEVEAYFGGPTTLWGLYGNNGIVGTAGNQSNSQTITAGGNYKIVLTNDGATGTGIFTLYELPSLDQADWDDTSNALISFTAVGTLNPDEVNIMPCIIPENGGSQRFVALKVE